MIPEGWHVKNLSEITKEKISYGIVQAGPHVEEGVPYIKSSDLSSSLDINSLQRTSKEIHCKYRRSAVHPNDIVFSLRGNIGESRIVPSQIEEANLTQGTARISIKRCFSTEFFYYQIKSSPIINKINSLSKGSTFKEISLEELRKVKVVVPPPLVQNKIARILSTWDEAITTTERLIGASQQRKRALMQQLLTGKRRLPGYTSPWETLFLSDVCYRVTEKNNGQSTNVVTISGKRGLVLQTDFFSKSVASETLDGYTILRKGQFAYNKSYSDGYPMGAIKRLNLYDDAVVTSLYICFEVNEAVACNSFMEHYFESGALNRALKKIAAEGGRAHGLLNVKPSDFFSLSLILPGKEEQKAIASVLSASDRELEILQHKLDCLRQEKRALMQQLLTGKRRVKVAEEAVA
ncbi:restriction endonuclease subunit S [Halomonas sp.]|uniref:restriction endonuclease subunit S n=1 Tax=Halomonas sp. TaxID=1486246 RepID=UPI00298E61C5|nr:restriction endonuclease subunit S [Halomonas sp.]MDW7746837.1 restriction endonuclease subunit S [Halomonas sp.]